MAEPTDAELFRAVHAGDDRGFERLYDRYCERARLVAWRVSHRGDWVDELLNEAWCRAFRLRQQFQGDRFLVWFGGILQNVYREHCRASPTTMGSPGASAVGPTSEDLVHPEKIAAEAELLSGLNDCVSRLDPEEARLVRLRFFEGLTLRAIAQEVKTPEATIREQRLPGIFAKLRKCLEKKGIEFSQLSPAQLSEVLQYTGEEPE